MLLDYLYFNLYNFYYKDGNCKATDNPALRASHVLSATFLFWILSISTMYNLYFLGSKKFMPIGIYICSYFIFFLPIYYYYYKKKNYKNVYERFKDLNSTKKNLGLFLSIVLILLPILLIVLFGMVLYK
jgi:Ca2+/Na+ antiporter